MELFDTHCHLDTAEFSGRVPKIISDARKVGVTHFIVPGVQQNWKCLQNLATQFEEVFIAPGVHPLFLKGLSLSEMTASLEKCLLDDPKVVALGEIGLDAYHGRLEIDVQRQFFKAQLSIAIAAQLPILLHVRKAHDMVLSILRNVRYGERGSGGIVHAYSGSMQQAQQYIQLGFYLGFGGGISYPRATKTRSIAAAIPKEALVLETDAPYMPLHRKQGVINLPQNLPIILKHLAELRQDDINRVANYTSKNAKNIFNIY